MTSDPNPDSSSLADELWASLENEAEKIKERIGDPCIPNASVIALLIQGYEPDEITKECFDYEAQQKQRAEYHEVFRMMLSQPQHIQDGYYSEIARRSMLGIPASDPAAEAREILATLLTKDAGRKAKKRRGRDEG